MNRPRLTVAVRRGLRRVHALAQSDLDVDLAADEPQFDRKAADEIRRALAWIAAHTIEKAADPGRN